MYIYTMLTILIFYTYIYDVVIVKYQLIIDNFVKTCAWYGCIRLEKLMLKKMQNNKRQVFFKDNI